MKTNGYFNNLEKYWSANFLALLASVNLFFVVTWALLNLILFAFDTTSLSAYLEEVLNKNSLIIFYSPALFSVSCFLAACISIFYILIVISRKKWCIVASALPIIIGWCVFFAQYQEDLNFEQGSGILIVFYILPMTALAVLISIGIYLFLVLLERIPHFRVPISLISQNNIFKKYIQIFYWFYFVIVFEIIGLLIYLFCQS